MQKTIIPPYYGTKHDNFRVSRAADRSEWPQWHIHTLPLLCSLALVRWGTFGKWSHAASTITELIVPTAITLRSGPGVVRYICRTQVMARASAVSQPAFFRYQARLSESRTRDQPNSGLHTAVRIFFTVSLQSHFKVSLPARSVGRNARLSEERPETYTTASTI